VNVVSKRCEHENCTRHPIFNIPGEMRGKYCGEHKLKDMVNLHSKTCEHDHCAKLPCYNVPGETHRKYCSEHKLENMVNVVSKTCQHENCPKRPHFNIPGEIRGKYCSEHKLEDMVNVVSKPCQHENCTKLPSYNFADQLTRKYCGEHRLPSMINMQKKNCQFDTCNQLAVFGFINKRAQFCNTHQLPNMIHLLEASQCCAPDCNKEFAFVFENHKYCVQHCPDRTFMIALKRWCKYCDLQEESAFVCNECRHIANIKEWAVVKYLRRAIDTPFTHNSSNMLQGCSKRRPDIYFNLLHHCLIVEVDENQHQSYASSCECARICEIVGGIGGRSVVFIRYNPDTFLNASGKRPIITNEERLQLLVETIKFELINTEYHYPPYQVKLIQLFFDARATSAPDIDADAIPQSQLQLQSHLHQFKQVENITNDVCV
jgi:hypothetical protein